jgi:UDP-3-O-[3-hydroxymyristoyl] glucosamine N-acyltransferase LpxD
MKTINEIDLNIDSFIKQYKVNNFGYVSSSISNAITYIYDEKYLIELNENSNISIVIVTDELSQKINSRIQVIISKDPVSLFYKIYMYYLNNRVLNKNSISSSANISSSTIIASQGVTIEEDVLIEDHVVIKSNVIIKRNSVVRSGAVIGGDGFEIKTIDGKQIVIPHDGKVIIFENVDIGYNTCVDKGMFGRDTIIGDGTKIDNLCHISHGVKIGTNCVVVAKVMISGSTDVGNNTYIGPGATIVNGINIGNNSEISLGSTVISNIKDGQTVSGYFATSHLEYLKQKNAIRKLTKRK